MRTPLSAEEIASALTPLSGWSWEGDALKKRFTFKNFQEAIGFLVRIAFAAEAHDHHPEIANVYNRVDLTLRTHDAGNKVTQKDLALAQAIEEIARNA